MTNNFEMMMEKMMEQYMEKAMAKMMEKMFSGMMEPEVVPAEVQNAEMKTLSREDFLALQETVPEKVTNSEPIELVVYDNKGLKFNRPVSKDIWTINWIIIKSKYPHVKYDKNTRGFRWNKSDNDEFFIACRDYQVITEITAEHRAKIAEYNKQKAQKQAEYYANLAK